MMIEQRRYCPITLSVFVFLFSVPCQFKVSQFINDPSVLLSSGPRPMFHLLSFSSSLLLSFCPSVLLSFRPLVHWSFGPSVILSFRPFVFQCFCPSMFLSFCSLVLLSFGPLTLSVVVSVCVVSVNEGSESTHDIVYYLLW